MKYADRIFMGIFCAAGLCAVCHLLGAGWAVGIAGFYIGALTERVGQNERK